MPLPIYSIIDPQMQRSSAPVTAFDQTLESDITTLENCMAAHHENALAAIQAGIARQIVIVNITDEQGAPQRHILINPRIVEYGTERRQYQEQCTSVPGEILTASRAETVVVNYQDRSGAAQTLHAAGLLAVYLQHTIDHLANITPLDALSPLKQQIILKRLKKKAHHH